MAPDVAIAAADLAQPHALAGDLSDFAAREEARAAREALREVNAAVAATAEEPAVAAALEAAEGMDADAPGAIALGVVMDAAVAKYQGRPERARRRTAVAEDVAAAGVERLELQRGDVVPDAVLDALRLALPAGGRLVAGSRVLVVLEADGALGVVMPLEARGSGVSLFELVA